mmetsp:Transcript_144592/g.402924  ORF Transcript_144592/g.402924 Transcript_144592/m.402924 type:complete len:259 (-) Transcript_144592:1664-2440(-)
MSPPVGRRRATPPSCRLGEQTRLVLRATRVTGLQGPFLQGLHAGLVEVTHKMHVVGSAPSGRTRASTTWMATGWTARSGTSMTNGGGKVAATAGPHWSRRTCSAAVGTAHNQIKGSGWCGMESHALRGKETVRIGRATIAPRESPQVGPTVPTTSRRRSVTRSAASVPAARAQAISGECNIATGMALVTHRAPMISAMMPSAPVIPGGQGASVVPRHPPTTTTTVLYCNANEVSSCSKCRKRTARTTVSGGTARASTR